MNCELAAGDRVNVYPNSAYKYEEAITQLVVALKLTSPVAVIRCLDHQKTDTLIPK